MKIADALNKKLAIIAWITGENGEDAAVFTGIFIKQDSRYFLDRGEGEPSLDILNEWLPRIEPVFEDIREILLGGCRIMIRQD